MENIIIEGKSSPPKGFVIFLRVMAIVYFLLIVTFPIGIIFLCIASGIKNPKIAVTENAVIGTYGSLAKRDFHLPIDSINSVVTVGKGNSFQINTSSAKLNFNYIPNGKEIVDVINNLIQKRKNNGNITVAVSNADELKKYKELLDAGVITQEEYDTKKKQLLGL